MGWGMLIPVLPGLHLEMQLTTVTIGSITSIVSMIVFLSGAVQGKIADMIGKVAMLRLSVLSQLLGMILMFLAIRLRSVTLFILARCVPACCKCGMVVSQAFLCELRSANDKDGVKDIGRLIAFSNIAYILGPILGGFLYTFCPDAIYVAGIVFNVCSLCLLSLLASWTSSNLNHSLIKPILAVQPASSATEGTTKLLRYLHIKFAFQLGNTLFEALFAQHAMTSFRLSSSSTGLLLGWCGLLSALTNIFLLPFVSSPKKKEEEEKRVLPALTAALALGLSLWATSDGGTIAIFASSLVTIASNLFLCLLQGLIAQTQRKSGGVISRPRSRSPPNTSLSNMDDSGSATIKAKKMSVSSSNSQYQQMQPLDDPIVSSCSSRRARSESFSAPSSSSTSPIMTNSDSITNSIDISTAMALRRRQGKRRSGSEDLDANGRQRSSNPNANVALSLVRSTSTSPNASSSGCNGDGGMGAVMGLSSTADRAARIVSPALGSLLAAKMGSAGLVLYSCLACLYCFVLLLHGSYDNSRVSSWHGNKKMLKTL